MYYIKYEDHTLVLRRVSYLTQACCESLMRSIQGPRVSCSSYATGFGNDIYNFYLRKGHHIAHESTSFPLFPVHRYGV